MTNVTWPDLLLDATDECVAVLTKGADLDWTVTAGELEWSCRKTLDHIVLGEIVYTGQLVARPDNRFSTLFAHLNEEAPITACLEGMAVSTAILAAVVRDMASDIRAFHPWGTSDRTGFAAMGTLELLAHTFDITRGLSLEWELPDRFSAPVVERLFPNHPSDCSPTAALLWCTGRMSLPGRGRRLDWEAAGWDSSVR